MKNYFTIALFVLISCVQMSYADDFKRKIVKVDLAEVETETIADFQRLGLDVLTVYPEEQAAEVVIHSAAELKKIAELGLTRKIIIDDIDSYAETLRQQDYLDHFHTYSQMLTELQDVQAAHPDIARLYDIGDSWEKTRGVADRDIWAMKISDNVEQEEPFECEVLYIANHHAREIITPEILLYFINYLVDNYGVDPKVTDIVNNRQLWLIPMMNPDGHEYVFTTDMWWRKNRRDNGDGYYGVDLNRNWGYMWGLDDQGSSPYSWSSTYRGTEAFSEPETRAVRDLTLAHRFIISLSYHSYSRLYLFPWGYVQQRTPDHATFLEIADSMAAYNGYRPEMGWQLYLVNGDSDDWLYGEQEQKNKIFAFTPEVGTQFHPDTSVIMKEILENLGPNLFVAYAADRYSPLHQISHTPLKDTEDPAGPYPVTLTIKPFCVRLDTMNLFLFYNTTGMAPFDSLALSPADTADEYQAAIPGFGDGVTIFYYFSTMDMIGRKVAAPGNAPDSLYSFTVQADTIAPKIAHTPLEDQCQYLDNFVITATISDNIGISGASLQYRTNYGEIVEVAFTRKVGTDIYEATIPAGLDSGSVVEYKIVAVDQAHVPNQATAPVSGFYQFEIIDHFIFTFENNDDNFTASDPGWEWGTPQSGPDSAHSGSNVWATNLAGNYADNSLIFLESPSINLKNFPLARLEFYHYYDFESDIGKYWDGGNVEISDDDGQNWHLLEPALSYPCDNIYALQQPGFGAKSQGWGFAEFDLNAYLGKQIKFRFQFGSDAENNRPGWYLDDIAIRPRVVTAIETDKTATRNDLPQQFWLGQNYPNPFNPETKIQFHLAKDGWVSLKIYNTLGQVVTTLADEHKPAGKYVLTWNGANDLGKKVAAGIYFYVIKSGSFQQTQKMILLP